AKIYSSSQTLYNLKNGEEAMRLVLCFVMVFIGVNVQADDLSSLSDEFNDQSAKKNWEYFHEVEGWPNRIEEMKIDSGSLFIAPQVSAWVADLQGVFLFKKIKGDFIVTTRVYVSGKNREKSGNDWALAGLMARTAKNGTKEQWKPNSENWVYLMHGKSPYPFRSSITDSKSNRNSKWEADLEGSKACNELYRVSDFDFNARTSFFKDEVPDMIARFDYVHYRRPNITTEITEKTSDKNLLAILGKN
ncbi:MAG: hypothetical protein U9O64_02795, partial [Campylobacterota bacterium]|nr:hypothetical protein [Campylobacterota bacterium]